MTPLLTKEGLGGGSPAPHLVTRHPQQAPPLSSSTGTAHVILNLIQDPSGGSVVANGRHAQHPEHAELVEARRVRSASHRAGARGNFASCEAEI